MPAAVLGEQPLQLTGTLSVLHASTSLLRQPTTKKPPMGLTAKSRVFRSTAAWVSMVSQSDRHVSEASGVVLAQAWRGHRRHDRGCQARYRCPMSEPRS